MASTETPARAPRNLKTDVETPAVETPATASPTPDPTPTPAPDPTPTATVETKPPRPYTRVDLSKITIDLATANDDAFGADETVGVLIDPETRSEVQRHFDKTVAESFEAWKSGGKPSTFLVNGRPCAGARRIFLDPGDEAAYRSLLNSAAKHAGCGLRILPIQKHSSGKFMLPWVAKDAQKRPRNASGAGNATENASENATGNATDTSAS